ncbi:hypothetical protein CHGG_00997 [Chaetomium globosum CBS 148.51]|uniref:Ubiquitin 3 binding protein But2 C-terminal domain-containing protein n=1 Tax=Chaetomium globosum (strain ATCC 6205 / CBS 148.51 / DSM 1962 / NBRC 6347 / NRRL 1970) TaxID=306901 RepID=Q2HFK7_CHAGB|nr:uncharacterized protein CHGG_00997 [Chaetomium globosum CBS 148.51]EAQ92762.1 hypothetical protein CHGG_00997 [Chaetomium globosum CBS 148.51]
MNRLTTAFALLPVAFATPFLQRTQTVNVVLRVNKVTSGAAIDVWNESKSEVLAQACSRSLTSGSFESSPILFTVDEYGAGTLSIGTQTYTIHDDPDVSGGIICGRIASPSELAISCDVSIPESLQLRGLSKRDIQDCFAGSPVELFEVMRGLENPANNTTWTSPPPFNAQNTTSLVVTDSAIDKRQGACGVWSSRTVVIGDGNPHQNPLHIQEPMECGLRDGCEIGYSNIRSFTISWSASLSAASWISGGFAVESSIETGNQYTCEGKAYDYFAVWKKMGQTAYIV